MRALAALVLVAACGGSSSTPGDAPKLDPAVCKSNLESELDRTCTTPADCVLVESADCCGPIMLGVKSGTESRFSSSEDRYVACLACPPLGCAHQVEDEAGHTAQSGQSIVAACVSSRCVATVQ